MIHCYEEAVPRYRDIVLVDISRGRWNILVKLAGR